jgi:hypothetical protein
MGGLRKGLRSEYVFDSVDFAFLGKYRYVCESIVNRLCTKTCEGLVIGLGVQHG